MQKIFSLLVIVNLIFSCQDNTDRSQYVVDSGIENFWIAYDAISQSIDSVEQLKLLNELYLSNGTPGLDGLIEVKNYTPMDFVSSINNYPKFWESVRANTLKADSFVKDLEVGIEKLRNIYPELKPAKIYFTIGAMRSNGTTIDSLVLIGSEFALADENTDTSEFPEGVRDARKTFFNSSPIDNIVLLNAHEYVHTQQKPLVHNLLSQCLYEGVAEFVSVTALGQPSATPAIKFGKQNTEAIRYKFETDMFVGDKTYEWIWDDQENGFGVRDLGYFVGYEISERYYKATEDKQAAIKQLIELDYENEDEIEKLVNGSTFFTKSLTDLYDTYDKSRPRVISIDGFSNGRQNIDPSLKRVTFNFSHEINRDNRGFDLGPLGVDNVLMVQKVIGFSEDGKSFTFEVKLSPNKRFQSLITNRFLSIDGIPLKPLLIDIKTK